MIIKAWHAPTLTGRGSVRSSLNLAMPMPIPITPHISIIKTVVSTTLGRRVFAVRDGTAEPLDSAGDIGGPMVNEV